MAVHYLFLASFLTALAFTSYGFRKNIWFFTSGYTFSLVAMSLFVSYMQRDILDFHNLAQLFFIVVWGLRLGFFIIRRNHDKDYLRNFSEQEADTVKYSLPARIVMWLVISFVYTCLFSPALFSFVPENTATVLQLAFAYSGLVIMALGIIIEATADLQKSQFKKLHRKNFCNTGLYKWVRCPNYFGEILVWTGNFIIGAAFNKVLWQWIVASAGYIAIVLVMLNAARQLELRQEKEYGKDPSFRRYVKRVPVLFPWTRIFSLKKAR